MNQFAKTLFSAGFFLLQCFAVIAQPNIKTFTDESNSFQITAPANWVIVKSPSSLLLLKDPANDKKQFDIDKFVYKHDAPTLDEFSQDQLASFKKGKNSNGDVLNNSGFIESGENRWWFIDYTSSKGTRYRCYQTIIGKEKYDFYYICPSTDFDNSLSAAESAIASFHFTNATAANQTNNTGSAPNSDDEERVNNTLAVIGDKPLWSLREATGWMKNKEGQWIEGKNKIQKNALSSSDTSNWSKGVNAVGVDNFSSLEVRDLKIGSLSFIILIKVMKDGQYKYENIPDSWQPVTRVKYWVLQKNETPAKNETKSITYGMKIYFRGYVPYDKDYLHNIALNISQQDTQVPDLKKYGSTESITLYYKELSDGKKCRFSLGYGGFPGYQKPTDPEPQYQELVYPYIYFGTDFYFECDKTQMSGFINMIAKR